MPRIVIADLPAFRARLAVEGLEARAVPAGLGDNLGHAFPPLQSGPNPHGTGWEANPTVVFDGDRPDGVAPLHAVDGTAVPVTPGEVAPNRPADGRAEVVFIDPTVDGFQTLASGARGEVVVLDPSRDGVDQIAATLAGRTGVAAVHVIGHGRAGAIQVGGVLLDATRAAGEYADQFREVGGALAADGDFMLYGCDVAAGPEGRAFISALAELTGADVAASSDPTGHAALGGDWVLEASTGPVDASVAIPTAQQADFEGVLAVRYYLNGSSWYPVYDGTVVRNPADGGISHIAANGQRRGITYGVAVDLEWRFTATDIPAAVYNAIPQGAAYTSLEAYRAMVGPVPDGGVIRNPADGSISHLLNGKRRGITSQAAADVGWQLGTVRNLPAGVYTSIPAGSAYTSYQAYVAFVGPIPDGTVVRDQTDGGISHFVGGKRRGVTNQAAVDVGWRFTPKNLPSGVYDSMPAGAAYTGYEAYRAFVGPIPDGTMVRDQVDGSVSVVAGGQRHYISYQVATDLRWQFTAQDLPTGVYTTIPQGAAFTAIEVRYALLGGSGGPLGNPRSGVIAGEGFVRQVFDGGVIYQSAATGAHAILGSAGNEDTIWGRFVAVDYERGIGLPTGGAIEENGYSRQTFEKGEIYSHPAAGARAFVGGTVVEDPHRPFTDREMRNLVGSRTQGEGSAALRAAMHTLLANPTGATSEVLSTIAAARRRSMSDIQDDYLGFLRAMAERDSRIGPDKQLPIDRLWEEHADFMASTNQLRYGTVVGSVLGIDAVFGALLNPTGGLTGPGSRALDTGDSAIGYHGVVHDAAGYLYNYHGAGPGYDYLGKEGNTGSPYVGQVSGILYWTAVLAFNANGNGVTAGLPGVGSVTVTEDGASVDIAGPLPWLFSAEVTVTTDGGHVEMVAIPGFSAEATVGSDGLTVGVDAGPVEVVIGTSGSSIKVGGYVVRV